MYKIIDLILNELRMRLQERGIGLDITEKAKDVILERSYSPADGARPLKRYIQKIVETELGRKIISGEIRDGNAAVIDVSGGELVFNVKNLPL